MLKSELPTIKYNSSKNDLNESISSYITELLWSLSPSCLHGLGLPLILCGKDHLSARILRPKGKPSLHNLYWSVCTFFVDVFSANENAGLSTNCTNVIDQDEFFCSWVIFLTYCYSSNSRSKSSCDSFH